MLSTSHHSQVIYRTYSSARYSPLLHIHAQKGSHSQNHKEWILQHIRQASDTDLAENRHELKARSERMSSALIRACATVSVDFPAARRDIIRRTPCLDDLDVSILTLTLLDTTSS